MNGAYFLLLFIAYLASYYSFCAISLDPEQKDQLIEVIEKLLADKTTVSHISKSSLAMAYVDVWKDGSTQ